MLRKKWKVLKTFENVRGSSTNTLQCPGHCHERKKLINELINRKNDGFNRKHLNHFRNFQGVNFAPFCRKRGRLTK